MEYRINDNELVYMISEDYDLYFKIIFDKYKPIIVSLANDFYNTYKSLGVEFDDFFQEGLIGLNKAVETYNSNDSMFYTYACICIKRNIISYCRKLNTNKYKLLNDSIAIDCIKSFSFNNDDIFLSDLYEYEFSYLKCLFDDFNALVFELKYNGFTHKEISNLLDISMSKVSSCICKIKLNLKKTGYLFL